jgi:hypothetical protein
MPMFLEDGNFINILVEGFGVHSKFFGNVLNVFKFYICDMVNE